MVSIRENNSLALLWTTNRNDFGHTPGKSSLTPSNPYISTPFCCPKPEAAAAAAALAAAAPVAAATLSSFALANVPMVVAPEVLLVTPDLRGFGPGIPRDVGPPVAVLEVSERESSPPPGMELGGGR